PACPESGCSTANGNSPPVSLLGLGLLGWSDGEMSIASALELDIAAEGDEAGPVEVARMIRADGEDHIPGQADIQLRGVDLPDIAAQAGIAGAAVDVQGIISPDGEDLGVAGGVQPGADLLGVAAQASEGAHGPGVDVDGVVQADGIDGVVAGGGDLLDV